MFHEYLHNEFGRVDTSKVCSFEGSNTTKGLALKVPLKGVEYYHYSQYTTPVKEGQILLLDEGIPFGAYVEADTPQIGMCLDVPWKLIFDTEYIFQEEKRAIKREIPYGLLNGKAYPIYEHLQTYAAQLSIVDWEAEGFEQMFFLAGKLAPFLSTLRRESQTLPQLSSRSRREVYHRLHIALTYLHDHRRGKFSLQEIADACHLSPFYLSRLFKKVFGKTLFAYHEELKMTYVQEKLQEGYQDLLSLAIDIGYEDSSYFIKRYKRHFGCTPGKFAR